MQIEQRDAARRELAAATALPYPGLVGVERILLRDGSRDGQLTTHGEHPDTLFRIDDVETREVYARVDDELADDGATVAAFRLDRDGDLVADAKRRFAPELS